MKFPVKFFAVAAATVIAAPWTPLASAHEDISHYLFVPNRASADVAVIDTRSDTLVARIDVGNVPHQVERFDALRHGTSIAALQPGGCGSIPDPSAVLTYGSHPMRIRIIFGVLLATLLALPAAALVQNFSITIDNAQAQAAGSCLAGSTAQGSGTAELDLDTNVLSWNMTWGNNAPLFNNDTLDGGPEIIATFRRAPPGVVGIAELSLNGGSPKAGIHQLIVPNGGVADALAGNFLRRHRNGRLLGISRGRGDPGPDDSRPRGSPHSHPLAVGRDRLRPAAADGDVREGAPEATELGVRPQ